MKPEGTCTRGTKRWRRRAPLLAAAVLLTLVGTPVASAAVDIPEIHGAAIADFDARTATVAPTDEQLAIVAGLGAQTQWNQFGTPQSLIKYGGYLAQGVAGADAVAAARSFLGANKALFRLESVDGLELVTDSNFEGSDGHVVTFRQRYGGLEASPDGIVNVGLAGTSADGWKVAYVSSTLTGDETLATSAALSPAEAWVAAAKAVGEDVSVVNVAAGEQRAGWTLLDVAGLTGTQLVRAVAFPTAERGVLAAYETYVSDGDASGALTAYRQIVDAQSGAVVFRQSAVDRLVDNPRWLVFPSYPHLGLDRFPWNYPSADIRDMWCWFGRQAQGSGSGGSATAASTETDMEQQRLCQYVIRNKASRVE